MAEKESLQLQETCSLVLEMLRDWGLSEAESALLAEMKKKDLSLPPSGGQADLLEATLSR
jgi:hypothetical protein